MSDANAPAEPGLGLDVPAADSAAGYRVLARKYRPSTFDDLIGQGAMVRTISNAFETGRIPQAWILAGVRGVGKTTTARILARALNYELPDGSVTGPTIKMPKLGVQCQAIMEGRHLDVLEMDAASHRGIDDVRQINDAIRYAPVSARYKVYILDEVHMLTEPAFNALLKTLEEPPPHAKFVFATTEIRDVPITVLSRCQRFDLRRVDAALLVEHLDRIATKESIETEPAALALIARAAEGSVRDSLSLLDQAIAHAGASSGIAGLARAGSAKAGAGRVVRAEDVRQMLGLADRVRIVDLFEALMKGDAEAALNEIREQYDIGADPSVVLADLAEFTHFVTRVKVVPAVADDVSLSEAERTRGRAFATQLSMRVLSRAWQMLLKGMNEVANAARPLAAAEMVLVRIAYAADLPTPDEAIRALDSSRDNGETASPRASNGGNGNSQSPGQSPGAPASAASTSSAPRYDTPRGAPRGSAMAAPRSEPMNVPMAVTDPEPAAPTLTLGTLEDIIALAAERRDVSLKMALERDIRLVRCEDGRLEVALEKSARNTLVNDLSRKLSEWTGRRWMVVVSTEPGAPTMKSQTEAKDAELKRGVRAIPLVQSVLDRFPGAEIVGVTVRGDAGEHHADESPPLDDDKDD